ncbi:MAG: trehalose-phosphatase, partial [Phycisphaerae bacterium]
MTISAAELEALAHAPILLVATDFDGTIAPLVSDPSVAEANREALVALRALADLPQTHVAIVSGRALADLAARVPAATDLHLVGSHGSEFEIGFARSLSPESRATLDRVFDAAREAIGGRAGVRAEEKPASLAIHYRNASDSDAAAVVDALLKGPATWPGVHVRHGKKVVELSVVATNKGVALQRLRQRIGATATIFLGDDATDEDAFATLSGPDLAVKVGEGATAARGRVADAIEVARVLATLAELRTAWASGAAATPIHHHALLSDQRTVALVNPRARVVWMCLPRIDAAASFAALLGGPTAGYFEISPTPATERATQCYLPQSFVLETAWPTLRVIDYLDCGGGRAYQRAGRTDLVRVVEGRGRVRVVFSPRLDFGRMETRLAVVDAGIVVVGLVDSLALYSPGIAWKVYDE